MKDHLARLIAGETLSRPDARDAFGRILSGEATPAQIAALLTAMRFRPHTAEELAGAAEAMRAAATRVDPGPGPVVDTCGTGGDGSRTFNISTAAAVVAAAAGVKVAKHGNRSVTSLCGSADVLTELGVRIDAPAAVAERCLREVRIGFLFAPTFHSAMRRAAPVRRELGFRTAFNLLGPLTNPAGADRQVIGVPDRELTPLIAEVLRLLGSRSAMVVCSADGLDEISNTAPTRISRLLDGRVTTGDFDAAAELGMPRAEKAALAVGSAAESAAAIREVLAGRPGPRRDIVLLNAAAALLVADAAVAWPTAVKSAADAIDSGAAADTLERWARLSRD
jgi:anthranilate phosphoribosyltransferase